jgi:hypothetical protein
VVNTDGEVGYWDGHGGCWSGFRRRLQLLLQGSPASAKCSVCKVWTGWVEAEKPVQDDVELVLGEGRLHVFDVVDVGQSGDVVKEGWRGPVGDYLMDSKTRQYSASALHISYMPSQPSLSVPPLGH